MTRDTDLAFLTGGGDMGARMRAHDWSRTPLGPPGSWPQSLQTAVRIMLTSRYAMFVWWGEDFINLYNDTYSSMLGARHPAALGRSAKEVWAEIWHLIGPRADAVLFHGAATFDERLLLLMERHGYREEAYFTFAYSPLPGDGQRIGGLFCAVTEDTQAVIGERRLRTLRDVAAAVAGRHSRQALLSAVSEALAQAGHDLPFAALYTVEGSTRRAMRIAAPSSPALPQTFDAVVLPAAVAEALARRSGVEFALDGSFGVLPSGAWDRSPANAIALPFAAPGSAEPDAVLVAGLNPYLRFDDPYRSFLDLLVGQIGAGLAVVQAYEEERRRAEALAEIDRAKTAFFSNISHEFRTPLTLMMGPLEDLLARSGLAPAQRTHLEIAQRNAVRLLKLVNTLLDFSRIEAGRIEASYEPVDLGSFTGELASVFRSTVERAGLRLIIDCPSPGEPAYVDREMWEKIVLNLISNAFKFTFAGEIEVSLKQSDAEFRLEVRDTGSGIPAEDIPRLFERFYRVKGARGRSYEGSGIGLALVEELVRLHGGGVRVESEVDRGSRFVVWIPRGKAHLPAERLEAARGLVSTSLRRDSFVEEARRWLPEAGKGAPANILPDPAGEGLDGSIRLPAARPAMRRRVLVADDNADMRDYVRRLLEQQGYEVETAADGRGALAAARHRAPDIVISDVMMPGLDGFGLLRELRADERLAAVPTILLSARAGEEARIEGMQAGADDYVSKPFSARELLARVDAHLRMAGFRRDAAQALRFRTAQFETLLNQAPIGVFLVDAGMRVREANPAALPAFGDIPGGVIGGNFEEILGIIWEQDFAEEVLRSFRRTLETGEPYFCAEASERRADRGRIEHYEWRLDRIRLPDGQFGVVCYFRDIAGQVEAASTQRLLLGELNHRVKNTLASVQAIAQQTLRGAADPTQFAQKFSGRIQSLARVHAMLTDSTWQGADLRGLIRDQLLDGAIDEARLTAWGPSIRLQPNTALHLALTLHELGTNSLKYGSLSRPGGWVTVSWSVENDTLRLQWQERGGPAVSAPRSRGFGTSLIEQSARTEGGQARMICEAEGITWLIELPLQSATSPDSASEIVARAQSEPQPAQAASLALSGLRFLVIEDEPIIALNLTSCLENAGAEVSGAVGTVKEALRAIETGRFDAALLDANLHGRPVNEVAAALRRRGIPFVFVTGYGQAVAGSVMDAPVVAKPFTERELLDAVVALIRRPPEIVRLKT